MGFTEDLSFAFNRVGLFRQVFLPVLDALFHVLRLNNSTLKVRLQSYTAGKGSLVGVGQTGIPVNTTHALTNPEQTNIRKREEARLSSVTRNRIHFYTQDDLRTTHRTTNRLHVAERATNSSQIMRERNTRALTLSVPLSIK
jgi:hypothetical protein